jgi:hypothetical protein
MPTLRRRGGYSRKFYGSRRIKLYAKEKLYEESAFLAYYMHWSNEEIMSLSHMDRVKWCQEVSKINTKINAASGHEEKKNIFSL